MTIDQLTGITVATALFDSLDGRDLFLLALAARDLIVTQLTDLPGHPYQGYSVSYLTEPPLAGPDTDRMADDFEAAETACPTCGMDFDDPLHVPAVHRYLDSNGAKREYVPAGDLSDDYLEKLLTLIGGFEFELCGNCGLDVEHHQFAPDAIGNPHAYCLLSAEDAESERDARMAREGYVPAGDGQYRKADA